MANGKYSINSTLVVTCAAKCEHVHRPVQLMPESLRRGQTGFRYGQDGSDIRDTRDEELSTWTLGSKADKSDTPAQKTVWGYNNH